MSHQKFATCIEACYSCAKSCDHCANACLYESNPAMMANCIRYDLDCADICRFTAAAMARGSEFVGEIAALCAAICDKCAQECEKHDHDHCAECSQACRTCATECRRVAA